MRLRLRSALALAVALGATACHDRPHDTAVIAAARHAKGGAASSASGAQAAASGSSGAPAASASAKSPGSAAALKHAPAGSAPRVELLSSGAAPRRALRYHFKKGQVEKFQLTTATSMTIHLMGRTMPAPTIPSLQMIAQVMIVSVLPDGSAKRELSIKKVLLANEGTVPSSIRHRVEQSLGEMQKLTGTDEMDTRGRLRWSKLDTSKLDDGQVKQMMNAMATAFGEVSAPFPEQPLGKGARWRVTSEVQEMGVKVKQVSTYTLEELDGNHGTTSMKLVQTAPNSSIQIPGAPMDVHPELVGMNGTGSGELQFELDRSLPTGHITSSSNVKVRTHVRGQTQTTEMDMTLDETFKRL